MIGFELATRPPPLLVAEGILVVGGGRATVLRARENQRLFAEVAREAFHDNLTGLANRANFLDRLDRAMGRARRNAEPVAVLCLDLDNFKAVNDALGHPAGDELLIRVAGRLTTILGDTWTVARLGGDEFAALFEGHDRRVGRGERRARRVRHADRRRRRPADRAAEHRVDGRRQPSRRQTSDDLLLNADLAMYAAKRDGGGCVRSFVPDLPVPWELQQLTDRPVGQRDSAALTTSETAKTRSADGRGAVKETPRGGRPSPAVCVALGVLALGVVVFTASTLLRDHAGRIVVFDGFLYPALNMVAAAFVLFRALRVRAERWPCLLIGAGMASSAAGDVVYAVWVPEGQMLSVADPLYLAFYPLVYAGIVLLMRERLNRVPTAFRLDALICGLTLGAVAAAIATGPIDAALQGEPVTVLVGLAYPVGDLLLLALTAGMLPILGWRAELRWGLLVVGFMSYAIADTVYLFKASAGTYLEGTWIDACWPIASLLIAVGGWLPSSGASPRPKPGLGRYVPAVLCGGVALAVAVLANQTRTRRPLGGADADRGRLAVRRHVPRRQRDLGGASSGHDRPADGAAEPVSLATTLTAVSVDDSSAAFGSRSSRALSPLDIDQFEGDQRFAGRHVGDQLVNDIAARLSRSVRADDAIARTGGDEFAGAVRRRV